jgi:hypothetical protein
MDVFILTLQHRRGKIICALSDCALIEYKTRTVYGVTLVREWFADYTYTVA